jgi:hypothetical protein
MNLSPHSSHHPAKQSYFCYLKPLQSTASKLSPMARKFFVGGCPVMS